MKRTSYVGFFYHVGSGSRLILENLRGFFDFSCCKKSILAFVFLFVKIAYRGSFGSVFISTSLPE